MKVKNIFKIIFRFIPAVISVNTGLLRCKIKAVAFYFILPEINLAEKSYYSVFFACGAYAGRMSLYLNGECFSKIKTSSKKRGLK